jgi:DNA polymerase-3 subunit gamma/tau
MADYLVLARKYRSATFEEVVGQGHVAKTLQAAIRSGRIAHAFLFAGTRGVGKTTVARILAKALNCLSVDAPTPTPCGKCDACQAIARGEDMDVIEIDGASNRGIEEIRELRSSAIYHPARSRYRIYYIDEVHMLTREAFNALLKTLEEPPPHVKFIFATTEPEKLPATVISRCQRFDFRSIPAGEIRRHLQAVCKAEKVAVEEAALARVARSAAGSMRDALSLLDQLLSSGGGKLTEQEVIDVLGQPSDERTAAVVAAIAQSDPAKALAELEALLAGGMSLEGALGALAEMFRNLMLVLTCGPDSDLIELPEGPRQQAAELAKKFTLPAAVGAIGICTSTARAIRGLSNPRGLVEAGVVRMAGADKFVDAASLVERLGKLSSGLPAAPLRRPQAGPSAPAGQAFSNEQKKR